MLTVSATRRREAGQRQAPYPWVPRQRRVRTGHVRASWIGTPPIDVAGDHRVDLAWITNEHHALRHPGDLLEPIVGPSGTLRR